MKNRVLPSVPKFDSLMQITIASLTVRHMSSSLIQTARPHHFTPGLMSPKLKISSISGPFDPFIPFWFRPLCFCPILPPSIPDRPAF